MSSIRITSAADDRDHRLPGDHVQEVSQAQEETGVPEGPAGGARFTELLHEQ